MVPKYDQKGVVHRCAGYGPQVKKHMETRKERNVYLRPAILPTPLQYVCFISQQNPFQSPTEPRWIAPKSIKPVHFASNECTAIFKCPHPTIEPLFPWNVDFSQVIRLHLYPCIIPLFFCIHVRAGQSVKGALTEKGFNVLERSRNNEFIGRAAGNTKTCHGARNAGLRGIMAGILIRDKRYIFPQLIAKWLRKTICIRDRRILLVRSRLLQDKEE